MNSWIKKDLKYNWHPYTQMKDCLKDPPILIERAKGIKLFDKDGNFYYDTISSWWCNIHGHNHPTIKAAIKKQLDSLEHVLFAGFTHKPAIELSEKLIAIAPEPLSKVFYSDNGSTAVEVALKMSMQYWRNIGRPKKTKFICLDLGYHGDTVGSMSVSGVDLFNEAFKPLFFKSLRVASPYCYRCPVGKNRPDCQIDCIKSFEKILEEHSDELCGIILEPILMAAAGMIVYPSQYLEKVYLLAKKFGVHLILDEVATGFGRTGKMFACQHTDIKPDFICLSKAITSGYLPFAATLTTDKIYNAFCADYRLKKTFYHGHTYTANPLGCAASIASLKIFKEEDVLNKLRAKELLLKDELKKFQGLPLVGDIRQIGLVAAFELVKNKKTKKAFGFNERIGQEVYKAGLKEKLILRPLGSVVYLYLPLCTSHVQIKDILRRTYKVIKRLKP